MPSRLLFSPLAVLCSCAVSLFAFGVASASPITYSLTGTFSGSLNGVSFSDEAGTFQLSSDTNSVTTQDNLFFFNTDGTSTFQFGSSAPVEFLSTTFGVESEYGAAAFYAAINGFGAGEYNELTPSDVLYNPGLNSGIFDSFGSASTSGGDLVLTSAAGPVTFQAVSAAATPEPSSLWLTATGLLGTVAGLRRRLRL